MTRPARRPVPAAARRRGALLPVLAGGLVAAAGLGSGGCQVAPLAEPITVSAKPVSEVPYAPRRASSHRGGFDASRIDRTTAATNRGGKAYSFASLLGGPRSRVTTGAPAAGPVDLSPPAVGPGAAPGAVPGAGGGFAASEDPAQRLFGSPAATGGGFAVRLDPTPVTGRDPGVATHTVRRGDSLWRIAERTYGSGLRYLDILEANPGVNPQRLTPGDRLVLPGVRR